MFFMYDVFGTSSASMDNHSAQCAAFPFVGWCGGVDAPCFFLVSETGGVWLLLVCLRLDSSLSPCVSTMSVEVVYVRVVIRRRCQISLYE